MTDTPLIHELRARILELEADNTQLRRYIDELREAIDALMQPSTQEIREWRRTP